MKQQLLITFLMLAVFSVDAQPNKTFFLGHSLVNFHMPNMVKRLADHAGQSFPYKANIGIGASLSWHYTSPNTGEGDIWTTTLPEGGFQNLVLTEALALQPNVQWNNTHQYTKSFFDYARAYSPDVKLYVYETWHCLYSGTGMGCDGWWDSDTIVPFRTRLIQDLPLWESIADSINTQYGANNAFVVPAGQAMLALKDSIDAGMVPGIAHLGQLFTDNIHLTAKGNYFIACVMYSSLLRQSPSGLPNTLLDPFGQPYPVADMPTPAQAALFQRIAWRTVSNYPKSGVNTPSALFLPTEDTDFTLYPNPADEVLYWSGNRLGSLNSIAIYDALGRAVLCCKEQNAISVRQLSPGRYVFCAYTDQGIHSKIFVKK